MKNCSLNIIVRDKQNRTPNASVYLKKGKAYRKIEFDKKTLSYQAKLDSANEVTIKVECKGYLDEETTVKLDTFNKKVLLYVREKEDKIVNYGGVKIPYDKKYDSLIVAKIRISNINEEKRFLDFLEKEKIEFLKEDLVQNIKSSRLYIESEKKKYKESKLQSIMLLKPLGNYNQALLRIRNSQYVGGAGPVFQVLETGEVRYFTNKLMVQLKKDFQQSEFLESLKKHGVKVKKKFKNDDNRYIVEASISIGEEIASLSDQLLTEDLYISVNPIFSSFVNDDEYTPSDFLWNGAWDKEVCKLSEAWELIDVNTSVHPFGSKDIILAIVDRGIKSNSSVPENEDFKGFVFNDDGTPSSLDKVYKLFNFEQDNFGPNNDVCENDHGVNVAGIAAGNGNNMSPVAGVSYGSVGAAPNTRLMGIIPEWDGEYYDDLFPWISGLSDYLGNPLAITPGADIIICSVGVIIEPDYFQSINDTVDRVVQFGRNGFGVPFFLSAGNNNIAPGEIDSGTISRLSVHEKVFACAASSIVDGIERKSDYSNFTKIEFCAPSSDTEEASGRSHLPPLNYRTWAPTFVGEGQLPSFPQFETTLINDTEITPEVLSSLSVDGSIGDSVVRVDITSGDNFEVGMWISISSNSGNDYVQILSKNNVSTSELEVGISPNLSKNHLAWLTMINGIGKIQVDSTQAFSENMYALIGSIGPIENVLEENSESVRVIKVISSTELIVDKISMHHLSGTTVIIGPLDYGYFGGTSSAAPLCGGIAALVMSVKPNLNWVEIREVLRKTAVKIDTDNLGFLSPANNNNKYHATEDNIERPLGLGRWMNKNGDYIYDLNGNINPGVDEEPHYSDWYGYGRLDAKAAVQMAIDYDYFSRDLKIRDNFFDDGYNSLNPDTVHSPDIWLRNSEEGQTNPLYFNELAESQNPLISQDRFVYLRINNKGTDAHPTTKSNLDAWVKVFIGVSDGAKPTDESLFPFSDSWIGLDNIGNLNIQGIKKIDEVKIGEGVLSSDSGENSDLILNVRWPQEILPNVDNADDLKYFILAHITPFDGGISNTQVHENNNLTYREIVFAQINFNDGLGANSLTNSLVVNQDNTEVDFNIDIKADIGVFETEKVSIVYTLELPDGSEQEIVYEHDGSNWVLVDDSMLGIVVANQPVNNLTTTAASGDLKDISFNGTISLNNNYKKASFKVLIKSSLSGEVIGSDEHAMLLNEEIQETPTNNNSQKLISRSHVFADMTSLAQSASLSYGPDSGVPTDKFRVTSSFTSTSSVNAYAIVSGVVMIQPGVTAGTVNLVLRPKERAIQGFTPIKYFIYRGLKLDDFIDSSDNTKVRELDSDASDFIKELYEIHEDQNGAGSIFESIALGYGNQPASDLLDSYFFNLDSDKQLPIVQKGTNIGQFLTSSGAEFGVDVILEEGPFKPDLAYVRAQKHEIDVSSLPSSTDSEKFLKRIKREEILSFMDLAAFYGMHFDGKVEKPSSNPLSGENIFTEVVDKFETKNKLYIDIRNENCNSYNFFQNYNGPDGDADSGKQIKIRNQAEANAQAHYYGPNGISQDHWPILIVDESVNTPDTDIKTYLNLRIDDNTKPLVYTNSGNLITQSIKDKFIEGEFLVDENDLSWTKEIGLKSPAIGSDGAKKNIAWLIKLYYERQIESTSESPEAPEAPEMPQTQDATETLDSVVATEHFSDNIFGPIDEDIPWESDKPTQWLTFEDTKFVDASTNGFRYAAKRGFAKESDRVVFYSFAEDILEVENDFVETTSISSGVATDSFLSLSHVFKDKKLLFSEINETGSSVTALSFVSNEIQESSKENLVLCMTQSQLTSLKSITGLSSNYSRTIVLEQIVSGGSGSFTDLSGTEYYKYRLGVQGLKDDGTYDKLFPGTDIIVYSVDNLLFTSSGFSALQPPIPYTRNFEENIGLNTSLVPSSSTANNWEEYVIGLDSDIEQVVADFVQAVGQAQTPATDLSTLTGLVEQYAPLLLTTARNSASAASYSNADDRPLYWARIKMQVALKSHTCFSGQFDSRSIPLPGSDIESLIKTFEIESRGYESIDFSGASGMKKILITGFDPFLLNEVVHTGDHNIRQSNPSGACVLALDGEILNGGYIQTMIFPVRYADFDGVHDDFKGQGIGVVEDYIGPLISQVDMIVTISQSGPGNYHIDRYATATRGGGVDNLGDRRRIPYLGRCIDIKGKADLEWFETSLPISDFTQAVPNASVIDYAKYYNKSNRLKDGNIPGLEPDETAKEQMVKGSGGNYLSNEIFYRVSKMREEWINSQLPTVVTKPTGHFHISKLQEPVIQEDFNSLETQELIEIVKAALINGIGGL